MRVVVECVLRVCVGGGGSECQHTPLSVFISAIAAAAGRRTDAADERRCLWLVDHPLAHADRVLRRATGNVLNLVVFHEVLVPARKTLKA